MSRIFQVGDVPDKYRSLVPNWGGKFPHECTQSTIGTKYTDGFTEKNWDFSDGSRIEEYRGRIVIYNPENEQTIETVCNT